jgi:hypothetical protein
MGWKPYQSDTKQLKGRRRKESSSVTWLPDFWMPPAGGGVLILSSRMSYELGQKAARAKILFILAVPVG